MRLMHTSLAATLVLASGALAGSPDLFMGAINGVSKWTPTPGPAGVQAYSFGITTCNLGDEAAVWNALSAQHPVFGQNIHRIANGRIEQIGMSFAWHGQVPPLQQATCGVCTPGGANALGIGCSSPDTASLLGSQSTLAPRSSVNAATGVPAWPIPATLCAGDPTCERLQVAEADLANASAIYLAETVVVHFQDAAAGATSNNASTRRVAVNASYNMTFAGDLMPMSGVQAWQALNQNGAPDAGILVSEVSIPGDGVLHVGSDAEPIGNGRWRYVIAIENISSDRAVSGLTVVMGADPAPQGFTFHDVEYHSGEVYDNADWNFFIGDASFRWMSPATFAQNPNTNALRWGTLYTFSFTSTAAPVDGQVLLTLFKPGDPAGVSAAARVPGSVSSYCPGDANNDGIVNFFDLNILLGTYATSGVDLPADANGDGEIDFADLNLLLGNFGQGC